jgi:anti-sigma B factor antagonist
MTTAVPRALKKRIRRSVTLHATCRDNAGVAVVDFSGRITLGEGSALLRDTIRTLTVSGQKKILLNLADVDYIDSAGIGELVGAYTTVRNATGELKLLNLTKRVHDLLQITKLVTVFDVHSEEWTAIHSFK